MFVDVLPLIRLPPTLGAFTYRVPDALTPRIQRGAYVRIPFRRRSIWGIVQRVSETSGVPGIHTIRTLIDVRSDFALTNVEVDCIERTAALFVMSAATVAYLTQPMPLQRDVINHITRAARSPAPRRRPESGWVVKLFARSSRAVVIAQTFPQRVAVMGSIARAAIARGKSVLILTPHRVWLPALERALRSIGPVIVLDRQRARGAAWATAVRTRQSNVICIGTRAAAFCAPPSLGAIIVDLADSDDHKQWDMEPKYDARRLTAAVAAARRIPRVAISPAPPIAEWAGAGMRLDLGPASDALPEVIDLNRHWRSGAAGFLTDACLELIARNRTAGVATLIVHNRKGMRRQLACAACGTTMRCAGCGALAPDAPSATCATCSAMLPVLAQCPNCGSTRLRGRAIGTAGVVQALQRALPEASIARVDGDALDAPTGRPEIIVASQRFLTTIAPTYAEPIGGIVLLHAERYARSDDYRAAERLYQAIQHCIGWSAQWTCPLLIQSSAPDHLTDILRPAQRVAWYRHELEERAALRYPPFVRLVRCDTSGPGAEARAQALRNLIEARGSATLINVDGPYTYGHVRRIARTSILLRCRPEVTDTAVAALLHPLPEGWQVDADPVELHA